MLPSVGSRSSVIDGRTFLSSRRDGSLGPSDGLFSRDTRHLSSFDVSLADRELAHVGTDSPTAGRRTLWYSTDRRTVTGVPTGEEDLPAALVLTREQRVVDGAGLGERVTLTNHASGRYSGTVTVTFDVDFVDVFEVRGLSPGIDRTIDRRVHDDAVVYRYDYADAAGAEARVSTTVGFDEPPDELDSDGAAYHVELGPQATTSFDLGVGVDGSDGRIPVDDTPDEARGTGSGRHRAPRVGAHGGRYDRTFARAFSDIRALATDTAHGPVPVAGTPWYAAVFGRDSLIAAYQALPFAPELAVGTLRFLAAHQGERVEERTDESPGKMLHELRHGELAEGGYVPHDPYYGSVDSTLLWLILLSETYRWTGDASLVEELRGPLERALDWVRSATDAVGSGPFLYYRTSGGTDLTHKAWRDTAGSVQFRDGTSASPPLASVDVQGYVYDALRRSASLLEVVGDGDGRAEGCRAHADALARKFEEAFWLPGRSYYAAALTDDGRPVDSVTSNVGHCLWSGLVDADRADDVADRLLSPDLYTGWGIRTMSAEDAGYSPVSYHTGSVWPHDTSLICLGLARYGRYEDAERVAAGLLEASTWFPDRSLPEVFCGFDASGPPKSYPSTCVPQAWAAGAPLALLRSVFDLRPSEDGRPTAGRTPSIVDEKALETVLDGRFRGGPKVFDG